MNHGEKVTVKASGKNGIISQIRPAIQINGFPLPAKYKVLFGYSDLSGWLLTEELKLTKQTDVPK